MAEADAAVQKLKDDLHRRREQLTLFRRPITTLYYFVEVLTTYGRRGVQYLTARETLLYALLLTAAVVAGLVLIPGPHQSAVVAITSFGAFAAYWVWLGVLSSIGLGTGLHTFLLYTGPFIAKTAFAAATCGNLAFDTAGERAFVCAPDAAKGDVSVFDVMQKVALVACLWGAGTAIGELPPYFVSRAAAQSGKKLAELEEVEDDEQKAAPSAMDRVKLQIFHGLQRWGFWAIVACASIPNPLFDLAGITCGHFGIPFWTFFGATFIGKAIIKMSLQSAFVIYVAEPTRLKALANSIESLLPFLHGKISAVLEAERNKYLGHAVAEASGGRGLALIWDLFLIGMIGYFVVSIIHSSVQEHVAVKDQKTVELARANGGRVPSAAAATATAAPAGAASPVASPLSSPVASPAGSRTSSRASSPTAANTRSPSGVAAAVVAAAAAPAPAAAASALASESESAAAGDGEESGRATRRSGGAVKRQTSASKLSRAKSKSKVTEEDDAAVAASFTPQRLTRSASRSGRSSRKLT